ncbi:MAG: YgeY family selenium metabolism-linked hydrolase [Anaerolineae bacterium]
MAIELSSDHIKQLVHFAQDLIRIPSPSGEEQQVAKRLIEEMKRAGLPEVRTDRMGNVIGRIGNGQGPTIMLEGHMDTIDCGDPSKWPYGPYEAKIADGVIYGLGAADMKGAVASMVHAGKALIEAGMELHGNLYIVSVVQEEPCEGAAIRVLIEEEGIRPDFVVIGEATSLQLARGQRGRLELKITTHGRSCHSSAPERGKNAIYEAARLVVGIELMTSQMETDSFLGKASIAVIRIESMARSRNAVPERCVLYLDRRLTSGETEVKVLAEIKNLISREGADATVEVTEDHLRSYTGYEFRVRQYFPCWATPENNGWLRRCASVIERELGYRPRIGRWDFSTDGVYTAGVAGIPTVGFGPGEEKYVHTVEERVSIAHLVDATRAYARLAADLLAGK